MSSIMWAFIIALLQFLLAYFIMKNSFKDYEWDYSKERDERVKIYLEEDRCTLPLWFYILIIALLFVPYLNCVVSFVCIVFLIFLLSDEDIYMHIPGAEWLTKEY